MKIKPISNDNHLTRAGRREKQQRDFEEFQDKQEFRFVNLYFLGTITYLIFISMSGINSFAGDYFTQALLSQAEYLLPLLLYFFLADRRLGRINRTGVHKIGIPQILISVVTGFGIIPFLNLINGLSLFMVNDVTTERVVDSAEKYSMPLMILAVGIIPPIVEELSYRGAYFTTYRRAGVLKGALASAFLFGLMHGNLNQFAYAFIAGFLFSMLCYAGGSVICTMIMHVIINSVSIISLYYDRLSFRFPKFLVNTDYAEINLEYIKTLIIPGILSLGLVMFSYYLLRKMSTSAAEEKSSKARIVDACMIAGIIIMVINMIAAEIISRQ